MRGAMTDRESKRIGNKGASLLIGKVMDIPLEQISPDPRNLREIFDADDIRDLGLNMKHVGQLDEITLFPKQDRLGNWTGEFDLHDGERRWRAAKMVGIPTLRARIIERPNDRDLLLKKTSRALQTRVLEPEKKMEAVEKALKELGVWGKTELWESYREQLGGGPEWPQIIRVLRAGPTVRQMLDDGTINFTLAQSIGRLPQNQQEEAVKYVVLNKLSGRFFSTEMVPYMLENPDASLAQAFEHTRVGGWRQYSKSPYQRGTEPPTEKQLEDFLDACVHWERAWEVLVHTGLVFKIMGNANYESRINEALHRIDERITATLEKMQSGDVKTKGIIGISSGPKLIEDTLGYKQNEV
jgi:ParB-like chromosome segregation protein Spo0J